MTQTWPSTAGDGITEFLEKLRNVGKPAGATNEKTSVIRTPYSLQDIKSGASALTKLWALVVAAAGGTPALIALIKGITSKITAATANQASVRVALILGGAGLLAVVALSIAIIVRGDVAARATAHAARAQAEGSIVSAALTNFRFALPTGWLVQKTDGTVLPVRRFNWADGRLIITTITGDELVESQWQAIINATDLNPKD